MPFQLLKPIDWSRIIIGWLGVVFLSELAGIVGLLSIIAVILFCAFGVVKMAERLAQILGDPIGSLILTLSIVIIEVILISAVMLGPGDSPLIARDSVMAVSMIILGLVVGTCLIVGGIKHGSMEHNGTGTQTYLALIAALAAIAFGFPVFLGEYSSGQSLVVAVAVVVLYGFFLWRQTGAQASEFQELLASTPALVSEKFEVPFRALVLVITVLPIVLLSHDMAGLMDEVLSGPAALAGLIIAMIVFLPETITALRAAWAGEIQRVSNLAHGALVSTVGLTIPSVLIIGELTSQEVIFGESPFNLAVLAITIGVSSMAFSAKKVSAVHGATLVLLFGMYVMGIFAA